MIIRYILILLSLIASIVCVIKDKYDIASYCMLCAIFLELL
jgi:hypothetical protein